jgi:metal-responsive CopG/Arc/MetJ family transcriptional regulator
MLKTIKFTISMSAAEFKHVESMRGRTGRTRSQFIRDAIAALSAAAGRYHSGTADLSSDHDRYLDEVFAEASPRKGKD